LAGLPRPLLRDTLKNPCKIIGKYKPLVRVHTGFRPKSASLRGKNYGMKRHSAIRSIRTGRAATVAAVFVCALTLLAPATAQSLKEMRSQNAEDGALDREAAYTESVCGTSISASIDWRSAADWPAGVSIVASCDGALGALEAICRTKDGKSRAKRISRFVCAGDGSGASLSGGTLRYGASPYDNGFTETKKLLDSDL
jgi:hypothetical protein